MIVAKISVEPHVAEYVRGKYFDAEAGAVRFPPMLDIYVLIFDLMRKRPKDCPVDSGNLEIALPDRREGKDPLYYNYLSCRAQKMIGDKLRLMMWAELHDAMDENKHVHGMQFKDTALLFMSRYGIDSISEDAMLKNYQRWRDKMRRRSKRGYRRKKISA
ncbi:MAG: hypothetical protein NC102_03225 [Clostridium sp.]|nr:hypothetical protein [Clostridium sp.]